VTLPRRINPISFDVAVIAQHPEASRIVMSFQPGIKTPATNQRTVVVLMSSSFVVNTKHIGISDATLLTDIPAISSERCVFISSTPFIGFFKSSAMVVIFLRGCKHTATKFRLTVVSLLKSLTHLDLVALVTLVLFIFSSLGVILLPLSHADLLTLLAVVTVGVITALVFEHVVIFDRLYFVAGLAFSGHKCIVTQR
jgi:hypothetical protein